MLEAVVPQAQAHDVFVATAAVADWRPLHVHSHKLKKEPGQAGRSAPPSLEMAENTDILATVAALPQRPFCVGFAAESQDLLRHARDKLERKRLPLIVANLGPATFGRDDNALVLIDAAGHREMPRADKLVLARELVRDIAERMALAGPQP
jgi:phosphopantothenoylcysteine decarboxylase/phosphopantothenate--cysteine ligase